MKKLSNFFLILGAVLLVLTLVMSVAFLNAPVTVLSVSPEVSGTAAAFLDAVCAGDYTAAGQLLYGTPDLGLDQTPADDVGQILWDAFVESTAYTLEGTPYATDEGFCQDVSFSSLDLFAAADALGLRAQELLPQYVEQATDLNSVYNEEHQYREDFVHKVLTDAAAAVMEDASLYTRQTIRLTLLFRDGQWWVSADDALLRVISGGISG